MLEGRVVADNGQGQFQLQTYHGVLTVNTNILLPKSGELVLQLLGLTPRVQLQISTRRFTGLFGSRESFRRSSPQPWVARRCRSMPNLWTR